MYETAPHETRQEKTFFAAEKMGGTVVAGAITTMGSGLVLFLCQLSFFTKMAVLIAGTIGFSLSFALFFFLPLLLVAGPVRAWGDLHAPFRRLCGRDDADEVSEPDVLAKTNTGAISIKLDSASAASPAEVDAEDA